MLDLFVADDLWAAREEKTRNSKVEKSGVNSIILNDTGTMGGILCMREMGLAIWATSRRMGDMPFVGWFSFSVFPFYLHWEWRLQCFEGFSGVDQT